MSIRFKVILPYLLLTLIVAIFGAYWVTNYLTDSLEERLHNQLVEAGRVVSDVFVQQSKKQVDHTRLVYFTEGLREAIPAKDYATLSALAKPAASGLKIENLFIFDQQGQEVLHLRGQGVKVFDVTRVGWANSMPTVRSLLESNDPNAFPRVEISQDTDGKWYYFTATPIVFQERMIGVAVAGASLETFMPFVRDAALANIVLYDHNGKAITSTLQSPEDENIYLATLSLSPGLYKQIAEADELVVGENFEFGNKRSYSVARGVLQVGSNRLGVFAVVLPADFVTQFASENRNQYILIFSIATIFVIALGFYVAHRITTPLFSLVRTSEVIAGGNLSKRTGIHSGDEIGTLAQSFDEMTERLQQRTADLEKSNRILAQMDRTKADFINISAHELRTPLTLIQGYAYMIDQMATKDPELKVMAKGLMDGFTRMDEIVDNMLDVSKIDSQTLLPARTDQKLNLVIGKVHKHFRSALKERKLKLFVKGLDELPIIQIDPELMYKAFYHLVMNAIKYTPDGGNITIQGRILNENLHSHEVEISIRDTGIGIEPQDQELVFEKFYQTGETLTHSSGKTKFKGGGPGLGLSIARGIVQAHGGRIWLESPGHDEKTNPGTVVYVRLPLNGQGK
ncbi:MAG: ATP-binding protein [Chloroflexota bacterium]